MDGRRSACTDLSLSRRVHTLMQVPSDGGRFQNKQLFSCSHVMCPPGVSSNFKYSVRRCFICPVQQQVVGMSGYMSSKAKGLTILSFSVPGLDFERRSPCKSRQFSPESLVFLVAFLAGLSVCCVPNTTGLYTIIRPTRPPKYPANSADLWLERRCGHPGLSVGFAKTGPV